MWFGANNRAFSGLTYSTNFPLTENPISEGTRWVTGLTDGLDWNDIQTSAGHEYASALDFDVGAITDGIAQLKRSFLAATSNQFSEGTIFIAGGSGSHEVAVYVNMTIAAHSVTGYECYLNRNGSHTLVRWNGAHGDFTPLASNNISNFAVPVDGDVVRIERTGGTLSCYQNGVLRTTFSDSTYLGGNPGIGNNPDGNSGGVVLSSYGFKAWRGGSL